MKSLIIALCIFLAVPSLVMATRLVSDNTTETVESCELDGLSLSCTMNANGGIYVNIDSLKQTPGAYTVKGRYCVQEGLWCSDWSNPFSFTVPALGSAPATIRLSK